MPVAFGHFEVEIEIVWAVYIEEVAYSFSIYFPIIIRNQAKAYRR